MPTNDGVQLVRGSGAEGGAEGGSRREFVPFGALWARGGQDGAARMRVSRPTVLETLCSRLAAKFGRPVSASAAVSSTNAFVFLAPALAEQWRTAVSARV